MWLSSSDSLRAGLLTAVAVAAAACGGGSAPAPVLRPDGSAVAKHVVLVTFDTLRADYCSHNGHPRKTTPFLDRLAEGGASFSAAYAPSSWTPPTMASIMTGLHPTSHGISYGEVSHESGKMEQPVLSGSHTTLAERFQAAGFVTIGAASSRHLGPELGFAQGFDHYLDETPFVDAEELNDEVRRLMEEAFGPGWRTAWKERPTFLWIHYFDPHDPFGTHESYVARFVPDLATAGPETYPAGESMSRLAARFPVPTPELEERLGPLYEADIAYVDDRFRELASELGLEDEGVLVAVTADHGEAFGTHESLGHSHNLHEEQVRVPLVLHWSGGIPAGLRSDAPVCNIDLYATLGEMAGLPPVTGTQARTLSGSGDPVFATLLYPKPRFFALRQGRFKLVSDPTEGGPRVLYDLEADPHEREDVSRRHPWRTRRLAAELEAWRASLPDAPELETVAPSEEVKRELETLGYVH